MKNLYVSILSFGLSTLGFAGNGSQGGPPPLVERPSIDSSLIENPLAPQLDGRLELEVTPSEMLTAIDAALKQKEMPLKLDNGQLIKITPETMDFSRREMTAKIKELNGTRLLLREVNAD